MSSFVLSRLRPCLGFFLTAFCHCLDFVLFRFCLCPGFSLWRFRPCPKFRLRFKISLGSGSDPVFFLFYGRIQIRLDPNPSENFPGSTTLASLCIGPIQDYWANSRQFVIGSSQIPDVRSAGKACGWYLAFCVHCFSALDSAFCD